MKKQLLLFLSLIGGLTVQAQNYDLFVLQAITWDAPTSGGYLRISQMAACNNGPDNANQDFDVSLILKDVTTETIYIIATKTVQSPDIPQGNCTFVYDLNGYIADALPAVPQGTYEWGVWVDSGEEITESNETNNFRYIGTLNYPASLSINQPDNEPDVKLYPNPATDVLTISGLQNGDSVHLSDIMGKTVYTAISNEQSNTIDTRDFPTGIYLLRVETNGTTNTKKLMINK
ncbi:MAG: T9SS type A sorting domain-containing protein [Crocinitomicaceae bacterium]|nr:T9SS type A sorting domain-containing protein [Crocinitomicaceae bacterium]